MAGGLTSQLRRQIETWQEYIYFQIFWNYKLIENIYIYAWNIN